MKRCTRCLEVKDRAAFPPDGRAPDGKQARCRKCINEWMKIHYRKNPAWAMWRRAKARAAKKGWKFDITVDDLSPLPETCPVFGEKLHIAETTEEKKSKWAYSLDRIDNSKGYTKDNIVIMSYHANRLKNDGSADEHEKIARWMRSVEKKQDEII